MCASAAHQAGIITAARLHPGGVGGGAIGCDRGGISSPSSSPVMKRMHNSAPRGHSHPRPGSHRGRSLGAGTITRAVMEASPLSTSRCLSKPGDKRHESIQVESQSYHDPAYCFSIIAHLHEMDVAASNRAEAAFLYSILQSKWAAV